MDKLGLAEALADCVDDIKAGLRSPEDCLADHPGLRDELEPLLALAQRLEPLPPLPIDPAQRVRARYRFVEALHQEPQRRAGEWWRSPWLGLAGVPALRGLPVAAALAVAVPLASGAGVTLAAQGALPGDALYGVKTATEQVRLAATVAASDQAGVQVWIVDRRFREVIQASERDDLACVIWAADGYEAAVDTAYQRVGQAQEAGQDGERLRSRLADDQARQLVALASAAAKAPEPARPVLERVQEKIRTRLAERAADRRGGADDPGPEARGPEPEDRGREAELRGREAEDRGRESELHGREPEPGDDRSASVEPRGPAHEQPGDDRRADAAREARETQRESRPAAPTPRPTATAPRRDDAGADDRREGERRPDDSPSARPTVRPAASPTPRPADDSPEADEAEPTRAASSSPAPTPRPSDDDSDDRPRAPEPPRAGDDRSGSGSGKGESRR